MQEKNTSIKNSKNLPEIKSGQKVKTVTIYPANKREISPEPYYSTDRYRLSSPMFPDLKNSKI